MCLREEGNMVIITMVFSSIITILVLSFLCITINNCQYMKLNIHRDDMYNIGKDESEVLEAFMKNINDYGFFNIKANNNIYILYDTNYELEYDPIEDCFKLFSYEKNVSRIINYKVKEDTIILIPSYNYERVVKNNL